MNRRNLIRKAATLVGGIIAGTTTSSFAAKWKTGAAMPSLSDFGLEGKLPSLKGKVVYLDFWASWCSPCHDAFPVINAWQRELGGQGLVVLGVNVDEDGADMKKFLAKTQADFAIVRDAAQKLVAAANVETMPTSFLIDRKGVIRHVHLGFRSKDAAELKTKIQELLSDS